jgi:DNA-binding MarR family transcriptional regulator
MEDEQMVGYLVWRLATTWRTEMDRALGPLDLTHAQYSLLASLYGMSQQGHRPSQRELADWTGLDPIYVSKLARALEQSGLLNRKEHPKDPRAVQLELTQKGTERVTEAIPRVQALLASLTEPIGGLHGPENRQFVRTLTTLLSNRSTP